MQEIIEKFIQDGIVRWSEWRLAPITYSFLIFVLHENERGKKIKLTLLERKNGDNGWEKKVKMR